MDDIGRILPGAVIVEEGMEGLRLSVVTGLVTGEPLDEGAVGTCGATCVLEDR